MTAERRGLSAFAQAVVATLTAVPHGRVVSYGGIAQLMGRPRAGRGVGSVLLALPDDIEVPWWRVINARGEISPGADPHRARLQRTLLRREGVRFDRAGRISWAKYGWSRVVES